MQLVPCLFLEWEFFFILLAPNVRAAWRLSPPFSGDPPPSFSLNGGTAVRTHGRKGTALHFVEDGEVKKVKICSAFHCEPGHDHVDYRRGDVEREEEQLDRLKCVKVLHFYIRCPASLFSRRATQTLSIHCIRPVVEASERARIKESENESQS